ncbi:MAG TPA: ABC transporter permease [Thermoleophilia bacterium]|nr:ABC transporter permease [Thermoleophilia bacterium]
MSDRSGVVPGAAGGARRRRIFVAAKRVGLSLMQPVASVIIATVIGGVVMAAFGFDPFSGYAGLFRYAFLSEFNFTVTVLNSIPLIFTGLAVAFAFRCGLFNIGAEGQLMVGSLFAGWLGTLISLPMVITVPLLLIVGAVTGALWALLPGILKATTGAHEVITTMMMSWIGLYLTSYLVKNVLMDPRTTLPASNLISEQARLLTLNRVLPFLFRSPTRLHLGVVLAVLAAVFIWYLLTRTSLGFEVRAVGSNPFAAEAGGVSVRRNVIVALLISGALAGLGGTVEVMGLHYRVYDHFSAGYGFTGITVALLAKNHPLGVIPAALLFGALTNGGAGMQLKAGIPIDIVDVLSGVIIFLVAAEELFNALKRRQEKRSLLSRSMGGAEIDGRSEA